MFVNKTYHNIELYDETKEHYIFLDAAEYGTIPHFTMKLTPTKIYQIENQDTKPKSYAFPILQLNDINLKNELPEEQEGIKYIVYLDVALAMGHRKDLIIVSPDVHEDVPKIDISRLIMLNKGLH